MLKDEIQLYESLTGKDANSVSVAVMGAFLDGYEIGKKENEPKKSEWIPVSEKLPEVGQNVIVTDDRDKVFEYKLDSLDVDKYTTGKWRFLEHEIIAWQPLPEPYEGGRILNLDNEIALYKKKIDFYKDYPTNETMVRELEFVLVLLEQIKNEKKGKWTDVNGDTSLWKCSNCGETSCCRGKYCLECGAKMEVSE